MTDFAKYIQSFFHKYLLGNFGASSNTIRGYKKSFSLLVTFMNNEKKIPPHKLELKHLNKDSISDFLQWLEFNCNNSVSTRNNRYAAICSFCKYLQYEVPDRLAEWQSIRLIKTKKELTKSINYLSIEGIRLLLEQISGETPISRRDLAMLALLYDSGMRVQELVDLSPSCVRFEYPYHIRVTGKGNKQRDIPLLKEQINLLERYVKENHLLRPEKQFSPLFFNRGGGKLTTAGVTYILKKYAKSARIVNSQLIPEIISPHVFRHSKAMHLLQGGVNIVYIRDILGHVSVQTTERYARADSKHKREALEAAYEDVIPEKEKMGSWEGNNDEIDFLTNLGI
ncbi:site-specific integrase [Elizabethkingia anophelis]|uniref:site-specific integrase n=1 Tax=Elizabethkingia anophelis TaxID=1117645 RepID=UPI00136EE1A0|nr:site-specific integrase [Elizabethkingia anophelis]MYY29521.1 integrase [Elizabethkingia anophelis]HAY3506929.1 tyrosine-type recombinase/integrase [Elizabethkingia anophelis]